MTKRDQEDRDAAILAETFETMRPFTHPDRPIFTEAPDGRVIAVGPRSAWMQPHSLMGCRRDPQAGPGSCRYWWKGCPRAADRGCHLLWNEAQLGGSE